MPRKDIILSLPSFAIKKISGYNALILELNYRSRPRCDHCNGLKLRKKATFMRNVRHELIGHRRTMLRFKA